jgi:uncharacterized Zn finger protein (UPF0148 family)
MNVRQPYSHPSRRRVPMFEGDYCPNCDSYIKQMETENAQQAEQIEELEKELSKYQSEGLGVLR